LARGEDRFWLAGFCVYAWTTQTIMNEVYPPRWRLALVGLALGLIGDLLLYVKFVVFATRPYTHPAFFVAMLVVGPVVCAILCSRRPIEQSSPEDSRAQWNFSCNFFGGTHLPCHPELVEGQLKSTL